MLLILLLIFPGYGCREGEKDTSESAELHKKIDKLQTEMQEIKQLLAQKNEVSAKDDAIVPVPRDQVKTEINVTIKKKEISKQKHVLPVVKKEPVRPVVSEPEIYYYKSFPAGRVSVKTTPWKDGRRTVTLYNPSGEKTFEREDVRQSYSDVCSFHRFHDNGALAEMSIHLNPGASMYWYDTAITFSKFNEPEWKTSIKHPSTLEEQTNSRFYWDKKEKSWKKQEIITEQPVSRTDK